MELLTVEGKFAAAKLVNYTKCLFCETKIDCIKDANKKNCNGVTTIMEEAQTKILGCSVSSFWGETEF